MIKKKDPATKVNTGTWETDDGRKSDVTKMPSDIRICMI